MCCYIEEEETRDWDTNRIGYNYTISRSPVNDHWGRVTHDQHKFRPLIHSSILIIFDVCCERGVGNGRVLVCQKGRMWMLGRTRKKGGGHVPQQLAPERPREGPVFLFIVSSGLVAPSCTFSRCLRIRSSLICRLLRTSWEVMQAKRSSIPGERQ